MNLHNSDLAQMLGALGHLLRLDIFQFVVAQGPEGVPAGVIARDLGIGASNLSFHLKELRQAGWIAAERHGQQIFYRARYEQVQAFLDSFERHCCAGARVGCAPVCGDRRTTQSDETGKEAI